MSLLARFFAPARARPHPTVTQLPSGKQIIGVDPTQMLTPALIPAGRGRATLSVAGALANVRRWAELAREVAATEGPGLPVSAILGLMEIESGGIPTAQSLMNPGGLGRAQGLMQVLPDWFGAPRLSNGELSPEWQAYCQEPRTNLTMGIRILAQNVARTGSLQHGAAAYFGAYNWAERRITEATDVNGVNGYVYVAKFDAARAGYADLDLAAPVQWRWPVEGPIKTTFGQQYDENGRATTYHYGIDIAAPLDTPVLAPADGVVVAVRTHPYNSGSLDASKATAPVHRDDPGWEWLVYNHGSLVVIDHGGAFSLSAHTAPWINRGQRVVAGQKVGQIDNSGLSSGPHDHFCYLAGANGGGWRDPMERLTASPTPGPSPEPEPTPEPTPEPEPPTPPAPVSWITTEEQQLRIGLAEGAAAILLTALNGASPSTEALALVREDAEELRRVIDAAGGH